jgi:hypothetical protein
MDGLSRPAVASPQGPPPGDGPPQGVQTSAKDSSKKNKSLIGAATARESIAAVGIFLFLVAGCGGNSDEARIQKVVDGFATAVDAQNQAEIIGLLCKEEAAAITDDDDYEPDGNGGVSTTQEQNRSVKVSDIQVMGEIASARIARPPNDSRTLFFRKEEGNWKVCAPAAANFPPISPSSR